LYKEVFKPHSGLLLTLMVLTHIGPAVMGAIDILYIVDWFEWFEGYAELGLAKYISIYMVHQMPLYRYLFSIYILYTSN